MAPHCDTCTAMTRQRGTNSNGTWSSTQTLSGTSCRRYRFTFVNPVGVTANLPETGSYGVGGSGTSCAEWSANEPASCPGTANSAPGITTAASASPSPVTGSTTALSVLGADDGGEGALSYTWTATGPASVSYSANGTNASKSTTATFTRDGSYTFTVTLRDPQGLSVTSTVTVVVQAVPTALSMTPASAGVAPLETFTFVAAVRDQFAQPMGASVSWSVSGGGTIASGVFTAGSTPGGPHTVTATAGSASGTAQVTVTNGVPPTIATAASASPSPVTAETTSLSALGADDGGEAALEYTWASTGPAPVSFSANGTNAAKAATATFTRAGSYSISVTVEDALGLTATSSVAVDVLQSLAAMAITPATASVPPGQSLGFLARGSDQFGDAMPVSPSWTVSGGGTLSNSGVFTAGSTAGGPFTISASSGGVTATASVTVTSEPPALQVQLLKPAASAVVWGLIELAAQTNDDGRVSVMRFLIDGVEAGSDTSSPFTVNWDSTLAMPGWHTVRAQATHATGTALSPEISITIREPTSDLPPTVSFDGPSGEVGPDVVLRASASDDVGIREVVFELDGVEVAQVAAAPWQAPVSGVAPGAHPAKVIAVDTAGQRAEASGSFTVRAAPEEIVGSSCGCASGAGSMAAWLGVALLSTLRRRRR